MFASMSLCSNTYIMLLVIVLVDSRTAEIFSAPVLLFPQIHLISPHEAVFQWVAW